MTLFPEGFNFGLIYDLIVCWLIFIVALSYCKQGMISAVVGLVGSLVSTLGAVLVSQLATEPLFELLFSGTIVQKITQAIGEGEAGLAAAIEQYAGFLPQSLKDSILDKLSETVQLEEVQVAERIVTDIIKPLVAPILAILIFFVVFLLLKLLVRMLRNMFRFANKVPLLGTFNRVMGCVLGVFAGALDAFILMCGCWGVMCATNDTLGWLNSRVLSGSISYQLFQAINPFV